MLSDDGLANLQKVLEQLAASRFVNKELITDDMLRSAEQLISLHIIKSFTELSPEISGGGSGPNSLGLMIMRRRRQLAYSIKPSNLFRDPVNSVSGICTTAFGVYYLSAMINAISPPSNFPGFLITFSFAILRTFGHTISYGEAALLHKMYDLTEQSYLVPISLVKTLGPSLVSEYDYLKGNNSNEIDALIRSLVGWNAVRVIGQNIELIESIAQTKGLVEYFS